LKGHGFSRAETSPSFLSFLAGFSPQEIIFAEFFRNLFGRAATA